MDVRSVHIPGARLEEGETYSFRILRSISMNEGEDYLVLEDPKNYKILLPASHYQQYGFSAGQQIACRVDKINCNGRIYLEPLHPHYREGELHPFSCVRSERQEDERGEVVLYLVVMDMHGREWRVRTWDQSLWDNPPDTIRCLLRRIRKGRLYLDLPGEKEPAQMLSTGKTYEFFISGEKGGSAGRDGLFVLTDPFGNKHLLRKKYYTGHGLAAGRFLRCRVDKFCSDGTYILEPEHPCYKTGKTYRFPLLRLEELVYDDGYRQKVLVAKDCHGEEARLAVTDQQAASCLDAGYIYARVKKIRKGRLELDIDPEETT